MTLPEKEVILLGLIAECPIHAYGLEEKIRQRQMEDWTTISKSSIYRVLRSLEQRGLVQSRLEHEGQGATRKVYDINQDGTAALAEGVLSLLAHHAMREPFLVGLSYAYLASRDDVLRTLAARENGHRQGEQEITAIRDRTVAEIRKDPEAVEYGADAVHELFFDYILERIRLEIQFSERAQQKLKSARSSTLTPERG